MSSKISVTIGIPAYNEEANIQYLLRSLVRQKESDFILTKILIISDGSNDNTVKLAREVNDPRISVIEEKSRKGDAFRQNQILQNCTTDILVLLDADIMPRNQYVISRLVSPIIQNKADLVSGRRTPLPARNFFEKIINFSVEWKRSYFEKINNGHTVYLCNGCIRAFSKKLYTHIRWPKTIAEDAYSYLFCVKNGYRFIFEGKADVFYRSPSHLVDHEKQSSRFVVSQEQMAQFFGKEFVEAHYRLEPRSAINALVKATLRQPVYMALFLAVYFYSHLAAIFGPKESHLWTISKSSKKLYETT